MRYFIVAKDVFMLLQIMKLKETEVNTFFVIKVETVFISEKVENYLN